MKGACPIGPLRPRDLALVNGKRGAGKSSFIKRHLSCELSAGRRVLFVDPHDEYSKAGRATPEVQLGPLAAHCTVDDLLARPELLDDALLSMAVVIRKRPQEAAEDVEDLVRLVERTGNMVFGLDEVGIYYQHCGETLLYLATQSRHWGDGVSVILAAQRAVHVPPDARSQASHFVSFLQNHPADVRAVAELTQSEEFADAVTRLGVGEFKHWRDTSLERK